MSAEHVKDYLTLSGCYDFFNESLFVGQLPGCVLTFENKGQQFGFYRKDGFVTEEGKGKRDEISLNPQHFLTNTGDLELLQTLVHEMVHQWQHHFGSPSNRTYHNNQWATKMEELGLIPSDTGEPGGKRTGQKMADYPYPDGRFVRLAKTLLTKKRLISYYRQDVVQKHAEQKIELEDQHNLAIIENYVKQVAQQWEATHGESTATPPAHKPTPSKVKYTCPACGLNMWGKPDLDVSCNKCRRDLQSHLSS